MTPPCYYGRVIVDVDGVVLDLMGGFRWWLYDRHGIRYPSANDANSAVAECRRLRKAGLPTPEIDAERLFTEYMSWPHVYDEDVSRTIDGAEEGLEFLRSRFQEVAFCTAIYKNAPESYGPKYYRLSRGFPGVPILAVPSDQKRWVRTDVGIDDRWDISSGYDEAGALGLLFQQPWSEGPERVQGFDWPGIVRYLS